MADINFLFDAAHASIPMDTDLTVVQILDGWLATLMEIATNVLGGDQPLTSLTSKG